MKTLFYITAKKSTMSIMVCGAVRVARNDNDSNPSPGLNLVVFRN